MITPPSEAYVYEAIRLPRARVKKAGGTLAGVAAHELLAQLLRELERRSPAASTAEDVVIGVSTVHGEHAGDVARVAVQAAGWDDGIPAGVVSRMCCSGLDAIGSVASRIRAGDADLLVAGGVESMSRVPMFSDRASMALDPEVAALSGFVTIGVSADLTALKYGFRRAELDEYVVRSHERALAAPAWQHVVPVVVDDEVLLATDEGARPGTTLESLAALSPLFGNDSGWDLVEARFPEVRRPEVGLHTVASAPQMCDGASVALLGSRTAEDHLGAAPIGRVVGYAHTAVRSPMLDATVGAVSQVLDRAGLTTHDVDLFEINESFSVTPLLAVRELGLDLDRVNPYGGAVALGHPLGASGGLLLAEALEALGERGGRYAVLAIPAALGVASAMLVERLS
ncbi:MAG: acetyl-CoA C-acyltransferase [Humibacillus sp.]|nr:acetyl-CoA C-acyltransferase [Humibacillus sp.]MDN5777429.1 acetyl-CoA C-acyltransferase [Humibacillus sp.]